MKYYIIAGEASGDRYGGRLMSSLYAADPAADIRFWGGPAMEKAFRKGGDGTGKVQDYREGAVMGLGNVLRKAGTLLGRIRRCKSDLEAWGPDAVILIDYPGFNLRIARFARRKGRKVFYYIAPKTWASREGRIRALRRNVDRLLVIFPFEEEYFRKKGVNAFYTGNPLLDAPAPSENRETFLRRCGLPDGKYIALLPGSREAELETMLPPLAGAADVLRGEGWHFVVAGAPGCGEDAYAALLKGREDFVFLRFDETVGILRHAEAAVVNSGTASLEAALAGVPQVVGYRMDALTWRLAKRLVKVRWISLPNLLLGREAVKELLQDALTAEALENELRRLTGDEALRERMRADSAALHALLGGPGAADTAARTIVSTVFDGTMNGK